MLFQYKNVKYSSEIAKDIVVHDIEYMYSKDSSYRIYNGTIPAKFTGDRYVLL